MQKHFPVMLNESINALQIKQNGIYVDLTLGRAGHAIKILENLNQDGILFAFDKDKKALEESKPHLYKISNNFKLIHSDYKNIKYELKKMNVNLVDGIIVDLGVSSPQLDEANRGFSYNKNSRLDMRMNQEQNLDAYKIINEYSLQKLIAIFIENANVSLPYKVAKSIFFNRPITNTLELVNIIRQSLPSAIVRKKNPFKQIFQAIRIEVNNELESLKSMLKEAIDLLKVDASLVIITFHSIEDRIVKKFFKNFIKNESGKLPIIIPKKWTCKVYKPTKNEIELNKRSRSAKLRVITKLEV